MTLEVAKRKGQGGDQGAEDEPEQVQDRGGGGRWCREVCHYHPVHSGVGSQDHCCHVSENL